MSCKCGNIIVGNIDDIGYCRDCYIKKKEESYLDNTDIDNLGIVKWAQDMLPEHTRNMPPLKQKYIFYILLSLYDPFYTRKSMRFRELIAFREFAKSTIIRIMAMYAITHNNKTFKLRRYKLDIDPETYEILGATPTDEIIECTIMEKFICIVSETGGQAEEFVVTIRDEFSSNERLKYFYHYTIRKAKDDEDGQWTRRAFKINGIYFLGLGSGQRIRGRIRGAYRLSFLFGDDIYSEESVLTPETRNKTRKWWNRAAMNTVDTIIGKTFLVGTILHEDTVLVDNRKNPQWSTVEIPVMSHILFEKFVKEHLEINRSTGTCKIPFDDIHDDFDRIPKQQKYFNEVQNSMDWKLEWKERVDLYELAIKYKEAINNRELNGFYQEFFHITVGQEEKKFKRHQFQKLQSWRIFREFGVNWFESKELYDQPQAINIHFGVDIGSGSLGGDDTALSIYGDLPDGRRIGIKEVVGKMGLRDEWKDKHNFNIAETDREKIVKPGIYDEIYRQAIIYYPSLIKIGYSGSEKAHIDAIRIFMRNNNYLYGNVVGRVQMAHEGKKIDRIINTMLNKYEAMSVYHAGDMPKTEYQLEYLESLVHDDAADAAEVACYGLSVPMLSNYKDLKEPVITRKRGVYYPQNLLHYEDKDSWKTM